MLQVRTIIRMKADISSETRGQKTKKSSNHRKKGREKTINLGFYLQQNYLSKIKENIFKSPYK